MKKLVIITFLIGLLTYTGFAASYTSSGSGNWNNSATWGGSGVPGAADDVTIQTGHTVTLTANAACNNLTLQGTAGTRLAISDYTLEVNGTLNGPSTSFSNNILTTGTGRLKFLGTSRALFGTNWAGSPPTWRCEIALNSGATGTASTNVKFGFLFVTSGTFKVGTEAAARDIRIDGNAGDGSGTVEIANGATLIVTGIMGARTGTATTYCGNVDIYGDLIIKGSRLNGLVAVKSGGRLIMQRLATTALLSIGPSTNNFSYATGSVLQYDLEGSVGRITTGAELSKGAPGPANLCHLILNNINGIDLQSTPYILSGLRIYAGDIISTNSSVITYSTSATLYYADPTRTDTEEMEFPSSNGPYSLTIEDSPVGGIALHADRTINGNLTVNDGKLFVIPWNRNFTVNGATSFYGTSTCLYVESNASGTGSFINQSILGTGVAQIDRYYNGQQWHFISAPVEGAVSGMFTGMYLQRFNEPTNTYIDIIPTTYPLSSMQGFALWNTSVGGQTASYLGKPHSGTYSKGVTRQNLGWNLMGNPYPSSIDWDAVPGWTKTNVADAIYIENNGGWATYIAGVGLNGGSQYIAPGQGFMVECTTNPGTLGMDNGVRVHNPTTFFKNQVDNMVRLQAAGNGLTDETVVRILSDASAGFDPMFDARKLFGSNTDIPQIYSLDEELSINSLPETDLINLGFRCGKAGSYAINMTELNGLGGLRLQDLKTGEMFDLNTGSYTFDYATTDPDYRFVLHMAPLGTPEQGSNTDQIYAHGNTIFIQTTATNANATVYNILGQQVAQKQLSTGSNQLSVAGQGTYIVQLVNNNKTTTNKVIVR